jgi:hypothetical protein
MSHRDGRPDNRVAMAYAQVLAMEEEQEEKFRIEREIAAQFQKPKQKRDREAYDPSTARSSSWWTMYVERRPTKQRALKKFRRRFRMPYENAFELIDRVRREHAFPRFEGKDAVGLVGASLELLVLGALRYLGRGFTFDDIEEATCIGEETHRRFFHAFVVWGSTVLFDEHVYGPRTNEEVASCISEYAQAGFPGCIGSTFW